MLTHTQNAMQRLCAPIAAGTTIWVAVRSPSLGFVVTPDGALWLQPERSVKTQIKAVLRTNDLIPAEDQEEDTIWRVEGCHAIFIYAGDIWMDQFNGNSHKPKLNLTSEDAEAVARDIRRASARMLQRSAGTGYGKYLTAAGALAGGMVLGGSGRC